MPSNTGRGFSPGRHTAGGSSRVPARVVKNASLALSLAAVTLALLALLSLPAPAAAQFEDASALPRARALEDISNDDGGGGSGNDTNAATAARPREAIVSRFRIARLEARNPKP